MPSNYTSNYKLNQWEADDRVLREDFNADNAKLDAALKALAAGTPKIKAGYYIGDGLASRTIDLGFTPDAVYLYCKSYPNGSGKNIYGGLAVRGCNVRVTVSAGTYPALGVSGGSFIAYELDIGDPSVAIHCNMDGVEYRYIALKGA